MFSVFDFITVPTFLISWFPLDVGRFSNIGDGGVSRRSWNEKDNPKQKRNGGKATVTD